MHLASNKRKWVKPSHTLTSYEGRGGSCVWWLAGQWPNGSTEKNENYPQTAGETQRPKNQFSIEQQQRPLELCLKGIMGRRGGMASPHQQQIQISDLHYCLLLALQIYVHQNSTTQEMKSEKTVPSLQLVMRSCVSVVWASFKNKFIISFAFKMLTLSWLQRVTQSSLWKI